MFDNFLFVILKENIAVRVRLLLKISTNEKKSIDWFKKGNQETMVTLKKITSKTDLKWSIRSFSLNRKITVIFFACTEANLLQSVK